MRSNEVTTGATEATRGGTRRTTRGRRVMTWALMFAMTVSLSAVPRVSYAEFEEPGLDVCVKGVQELVEKCLGDDPNWLREAACEWAGGVGLITCLLAEAGKMATKFLPSPL